MALAGFQPAELKFASGLFNLMRNLGGAVGIAVVNTLLQDNSRVAALRLGEAMSQHPAEASEILAKVTQRMQQLTPDPDQALSMANAFLAKVVGREALTTAFNEVFHLLALLFVAALVLVPFCRPPANAVAAAPAEAH